MTVNETQHGHLLLADISGYTSYVASTELRHSQEILSELLECIVERLKPLMTISEIEGDAIFAYTPGTKIPRGEAIFELIETTYLAFRSRRDAAHRRTTCTCNACRNLPNLDLKFISHHGDYFIQKVAGTKKPIGSDVNMIHRLLKNQVSEATGWRAYALFTQQSLEHLHAQPEGLFPCNERYEHLGEVHTLSMDLHARYKEIMDARHIVIAPDEAHHIFEYDYDATPSVVWEWFNDPHKRAQWMAGKIVPVLRVKGRSGAGARNHCVHGRNQVIVEDVLDKRPYEYFTVALTPRGMSAMMLMTFEFRPIGADKTHFRLLFKAKRQHVPGWMAYLLCQICLRALILRLWKLESINSMIKSNSLVE